MSGPEDRTTDGADDEGSPDETGHESADADEPDAAPSSPDEAGHESSSPDETDPDAPPRAWTVPSRSAIADLVRRVATNPVGALRATGARVFRSPEELELTEGSIGWPLFYLAVPIIVTNLLQVAYNLADTFWLGHYSTDALAAVTYGFPAVFFLISLGMGISVAGSVLVAQYTGAGEERNAERAAAQTLTFAVVASAVIGATGYLFVGDFIGLLASPDVVPPATAYLEVMAMGLPFMFGFFVFIALMRGAGDTVTPMLVMLGTVVFNVIADPLIIYGVGPLPELGVQGAAIATITARGLAMVVGLAILLRGHHQIRIHLRDLRPRLDSFVRLVRLGVPASIEGTGRSVSVILLLFVVATFPEETVAAFGVGTRIFSLVFMPAIALDRGVETMTGQNLGADVPDRAQTANHLAAKASFLVLSALGVVVLVAAPAVVGVFSPNPTVVGVGAEFLRWVAPTFGFIGVVRAYSGGFRGAGKTAAAAVLAILMLGVFRLPVAWVASRVVDVSVLAIPIPGVGTVRTTILAGTPVADLFAISLGSRGIWLGFAVSNLAAGLLAYAWFRQGTWRDADPTADEVVAVASD